jgi:glycosyltransferase involved in cell wall biosynthesis
MRILNIMQCTNLGGMEWSSLRLMHALQKRGHSFHVISLNAAGKLEPHLLDAGISLESFDYKGPGGIGNVPRLVKRIAALAPDRIIMTGHNLGAMLALCFVPRRKCMLAQHFHHTGVKPLYVWRMIYRLAMLNFNAISFPSDYVRHEAEAILPAMKGRTVTVRNPLPLPEWPAPGMRGSARKTLGLPSEAKIVGNAGWLIPRKRFDVFIDVAARVIARDSSYHFAIAGDGPERTALEARAETLGIASHITWLGWQDDMERFYHSIDVLLFNTDFDAYGMTPVEAMANGIPVVASALEGGLSEAISSSEHGFMIDRHDRDALAEAVLAAARDQGRERARAARLRVDELATPNAIAQQIEHLLAYGDGSGWRPRVDGNPKSVFTEGPHP